MFELRGINADNFRGTFANQIYSFVDLVHLLDGRGSLLFFSDSQRQHRQLRELLRLLHVSHRLCKLGVVILHPSAFFVGLEFLLDSGQVCGGRFQNRALIDFSAY